MLGHRAMMVLRETPSGAFDAEKMTVDSLAIGLAVEVDSSQGTFAKLIHLGHRCPYISLWAITTL